jgi:hypothetical protein
MLPSANSSATSRRKSGGTRRAEKLESEYVPAEVEKKKGESERRLFVLQIVQPGLAGLMDGSSPRWRRYLLPRLPPRTVERLLPSGSLLQ